MTVHTRERKDPLVEIAELAEELCDARQHTERIHEWTKARNRKLTKVYITVQAGLIEQLRDAITAAVAPDDEGGRHGIPASRPPLLLEALARHIAISTAVNEWIHWLQLENRPTVEANIRALVGAAPTMDNLGRHAILADLRRWRTWAAVMSGWATAPLQPHVACPNPDCATMSSLRVYPDRKAGFCVACQHIWDDRDGTINLLARYIKTETARPHAKIPVGSQTTGHGGWAARHRDTHTRPVIAFPDWVRQT